MKLHNRVACISDADSAFGRSIARKLASEGARLVLNSISQGQALQQDLREYAANGTDVLITHNPLDTKERVEDVLGAILERFGEIDIFVHNQNELVSVTIEDCDDETFERVVDANVKTAFLCTQAFGRQMALTGRGQVIYVSSIHDEKPTGSSFLYSASKGAVQMLCREAALDLGRHGIRVNLIEMGPVKGDQERFASEISDLYLDYDRKVPSAELGTPEDLANLVWFLCIDESRYLNGVDIRLDGGFLLHYMDHKMKR